MKQGEVFGELTAIRKIESDHNGVRWLFKCSCGNEVIAYTYNVTRNNTRTCGDRKNHPTVMQQPKMWNNGQWKRIDIDHIACCKCGFIKPKGKKTESYSVECPECRRKEKHRRFCQSCGKELFEPKKRFCTECKSIRDKEKNRKKNRTRRVLNEKYRYDHARQNGKIDWSINLIDLLKRDGEVCALCGEMVDKNAYHLTENGFFVAHGAYPSIDHIIPLSKGGTHTWGNVQIAHCKCNSFKGNELYPSPSP